MTMSALVLAAALLISPSTVTVRDRLRANTFTSVAVAGRQAVDSVAVAASLDIFAVCLAAGMAVPSAAAATARTAPAALAGVLQRAADMLRLGAEPDAAWSTAGAVSDPHCESLLRLARRSAGSGAALADGVAELADEVRSDAADAARAAAERASVLIAGPLGLCFLPSFVCLGIVPVVAGLAGDVFGTGVLL